MDHLFTQVHNSLKYRAALCDTFAHAGTSVFFRRKEMIELSGNTAEHVYLVLEGCVKQYLHSPDGGSHIILLLGRGNLFNEVTLFQNDTNRVATQALSDVTLARIPVEEFKAALRADPALYEPISNLLASKLRITMSHIYDLSFNTAEQRLVNLLCRLCVQMGEETEDGIRIPYILTHEELAQMISASRSNVSRYMGHLLARGDILLSGRHIIVRPDALDAG